MDYSCKTERKAGCGGAHLYFPAPRNAEDFFEFKASQVYISNSRTAIANTELPLREKEERNKVAEEGERTTSPGSNF